MSLFLCVWVRCQHFIRNRWADGLSPNLKDAARRDEAHLCHGWHFNLSPLAVLFPSILHQCIRTNATGHKGISGFDIIDTHFLIKASVLLLQRCVRRGEQREEWQVWDDNREEIIERSNPKTHISPLKYRHVRSLRGQQENYNCVTKPCFILVERFYTSACSTRMNSWAVIHLQTVQKGTHFESRFQSVSFSGSKPWLSFVPSIR